MPKFLNWTLIHINNVQKKGAIFIVNYEVCISLFLQNFENSNYLR